MVPAGIVDVSVTVDPGRVEVTVPPGAVMVLTSKLLTVTVEATPGMVLVSVIVEPGPKDLT